MPLYKTITVATGVENYSFEVELVEKTILATNVRDPLSDYWDITSFSRVPDTVKIELYKQIRKARRLNKIV